MKPSAALQRHRGEIRRVVEQHGACNARVFGSVVHGNDRDDSDLDLLLRTEHPLPRSEARPLLQLLERRACRVDLQLETPLGGVALREWAGDGARVLVKTADGPRLVGDPWQAGRAA